MKAILVSGVFLVTTACAVVPSTGAGNYNGVPLNNQNAQGCTNIPTASGGQLPAERAALRCSPQREPIAGS